MLVQLVRVGPVRKPDCWVSHETAHMSVKHQVRKHNSLNIVVFVIISVTIMTDQIAHFSGNNATPKHYFGS